MTCDWWSADEDSKHGGYCALFDRDCSGTRDNDCCDIAIEDVENYKKLHMITPIKDWPKSVKPCGISSWCDDHPDALVEISMLRWGIKLKMQLNLNYITEREITYEAIKYIMIPTLDEMYEMFMNEENKKV